MPSMPSLPPRPEPEAVPSSSASLRRKSAPLPASQSCNRCNFRDVSGSDPKSHLRPGRVFRSSQFHNEQLRRNAGIQAILDLRSDKKHGGGHRFRSAADLQAVEQQAADADKSPNECEDVCADGCRVCLLSSSQAPHRCLRGPLALRETRRSLANHRHCAGVPHRPSHQPIQVLRIHVCSEADSLLGSLEARHRPLARPHHGQGSGRPRQTRVQQAVRHFFRGVQATDRQGD